MIDGPKTPVDEKEKPRQMPQPATPSLQPDKNRCPFMCAFGQTEKGALQFVYGVCAHTNNDAKLTGVAGCALQCWDETNKRCKFKHMIQIFGSEDIFACHDEKPIRKDGHWYTRLRFKVMSMFK